MLLNFKSIASLAAAAVMLGACSSDDPDLGNAEEPSDNGTAVGYASFDINLPSTIGSRSASYDDGTAAEYAVNNGTVLIFLQNGSNEFDYTFVEACELTGISGWNASSDQMVTTEGRGYAQLANISVTNSDQYYAFVMLNTPASRGMRLPSAGQKFGDWLNTARNIKVETDYLYMANAPRYTANAIPATLVPLDKSKVASSPAKATEPAATIFVERGLAKVTVSNTSFNTKDVQNATYTGDKVTITAWALDITNRKTFPARNLQGLTDSYADIWTNTGTSNPCTARFVGGNNTFHTVAWSRDPNYSDQIADQSAVNAEFITISANDIKDKPAAAYCWENTFDVMHMLQGQTTRVVFKTTYQHAGMNAGTTFFRISGQPEILSLETLKAKYLSAAQSVLGSDKNISINFSNAILNTPGIHAITTGQIQIDGAAISDTQLAAIRARLSDTEGIYTYLNGEAYYIARIKHFGDVETPWRLGDNTYTPNGAAATAADNLKYLGRYSVVRNNWYEMNVGMITNIGSPSVPVINPNTPDDENDLYVNVAIRILPWAKRVQSTDL